MIRRPSLVSLTTLVLTLILTVSAKAYRVSPSEYDFPALQPSFSTFYAACLAAAGKGEDLSVSVIARRVENYRRYKTLKLKIYKASTPAPVVYIISGLGGDEDSNLSKFLAEQIQKMGLNAVVVPNTMTANFVVGASQSGIVGLTGEDAKDLYLALEKTAAELSAQGLSSSERFLLGYSHGALLSSYLTVLDQAQKKLNFKSALLINPPVDLLYGLEVLDNKAEQFNDISFGRLIDFATELQGQVKKCAKTSTEVRNPQEFMDNLDLKETEASGLIGRVLSGTLKDLILATEAIVDHEVLPEAGIPGSAVERQQNAARNSAAGRIHFQSYVEKILIPFNEKARNSGLLELSASTSLSFALSELTHNQDVFLMHNVDDFLLRGDDLNYLETYFGDRARIYPYGGHLGNLGQTDNLKAIENWLKNGRLNIRD